MQLVQPVRPSAERAQHSEHPLVKWLVGLVHRRESARGSKALRVLETVSLGGRRQLTLVSCCGERYLIGMGADSVETIVRVSDTAGPFPEASCR